MQWSGIKSKKISSLAAMGLDFGSLFGSDTEVSTGYEEFDTDFTENSEENTATDSTDNTDNSDGNTATDNADSTDNAADQQRVPTADEIKALMSRIEQGTVTARDVAERFVKDENGKEWAIVDGQRVDPAAVITGAAIPVGADGQPTGQSIYSMVMSESICENQDTGRELTGQSEAKGTVDSDEDKPETAGDTQPTGETEAPDTVHPDSFAAINKDWDFGDGSVKDNPATAEYVRNYYRSYYGVEPTAEQLEAMVQAATYIAQTQAASVFNGDYIALCNAVVEIGSDAQSTSEPVGKEEETKTTDDGGANTSRLLNEAAQQNDENATNQDIASYRSKIAIYQVILNNPAKINKSTYDQIKNMANEIKEKAKTDSRYSEVAKQAQSLKEEITTKLTAELKKITSSRPGVPFNIDNILEGKAKFMIIMTPDKGKDYEIVSFSKIAHTDATIVVNSEADLQRAFEKLKELDVYPANITTSAHSGGQALYCYSPPGGVNVNNIYLKDLTKYIDFTKIKTYTMGQCGGQLGITKLEKSIVEQFKKKYGEKYWKQKIKGLTIYGRDHTAGYSGAFNSKDSLGFVTDFMKTGNIPNKYWYKYEFNDNGELVEVAKKLPEGLNYLNQQKAVIESMRQKIIADTTVSQQYTLYSDIEQRIQANVNAGKADRFAGISPSDQNIYKDFRTQYSQFVQVMDTYINKMYGGVINSQGNVNF